MDQETNQPEKGRLLEKSAQHRALLNQDVRVITERSEKIIRNALIIGGALAAAYWLVRSFPGSSKPRKRTTAKVKMVDPRPDVVNEMESNDDGRTEAGIVSQIGSVLVAQATGFLLSIAREKLVEYLQSQAGVKKNKNNEHS